LLKQPQFKPLPVEEQVVAIFAGVRGYLDSIKTEDVTRFETALMSEIRGKHGDILKSIREQKEITNDTEAKLKGVFDQFVKTFA
jgi:F-type H+-transporting ATPase subunit alpha